MLSITGIRRTSTLTAWHFSSTHPVPPDAKGVKVSHGNLLHNQRMIQEAFDHTEQACIVGRLPPYHKLEGLTAQSLSGQAPSTVQPKLRRVWLPPTRVLSLLRFG